MSTEHQITKRAADGTLTIAELREFIDEFEKAADAAFASPADGTAAIPDWWGLKPKARIAFGGGIKSISVTIPGEAE
jgi:glycine betaine/choline ABC-type transport system substrate-binding protein